MATHDHLEAASSNCPSGGSIHYTLVHRSWLNITKIVLNAMTCYCIDHKINTLENLNRELNAWKEKYNEKIWTVNWHFWLGDACGKLKSL